MSNDDVTEPWWPDDGDSSEGTDSNDSPIGADAIRLVTDVDLQSKRYARGQLADPTDYSARLVETARRAHGFETHSATIDRGLRVQLAHLIDTRRVTFDRDTYDIAYTIPPASWVDTHRFDTHDIVGVDELPEECDPADRSVSFTTADVVYEMLQQAGDELDMKLSEITREGVERLIGQA